MSTTSRLSRVIIGIVLTSFLSYGWKSLYYFGFAYGMSIFVATFFFYAIGTCILNRNKKPQQEKPVIVDEQFLVEQAAVEKSETEQEQEPVVEVTIENEEPEEEVSQDTDSLIKKNEPEPVSAEVKEHPMDSLSTLRAVGYILSSSQFWLVAGAQVCSLILFLHVVHILWYF
jgi:hypothetical protein